MNRDEQIDAMAEIRIFNEKNSVHMKTLKKDLNSELVLAYENHCKRARNLLGTSGLSRFWLMSNAIDSLFRLAADVGESEPVAFRSLYREIHQDKFEAIMKSGSVCK